MESKLKELKNMSIEREANSIIYQKQKDNIALLKNYGTLLQEFPILLKLFELDSNLSIINLSSSLANTENN